jgi:hypothetical protein
MQHGACTTESRLTSRRENVLDAWDVARAEDMHEGTDEKDDGQIVRGMGDAKVVIKPENRPRVLQKRPHRPHRPRSFRVTTANNNSLINANS